ncbi:probable E3 ubiquitin-protein ligase RHG1A [Zingiber officinale]|uniref:RING-type E3 ubiquitin transferase n=1 Tax=Zingiber officinale TaxID=94328 RepID=A0A8J5LE87_ZINOF|nr:probable E3 ubiquitin-protein ligase RHG1A [Zingiber officinale]KAG6515161.1 hypothetical protein ZIOFF_025546 [Zingiber officinale]
MYQHTPLKEFFNDSQDNHELHGNLLSPTDNNLGGSFTGPKTASLSIWDPLAPSSSMPPANLGSHEQIKTESGLALSSSTNNEATGSWIRESVSEANNWSPFVSEYVGLSNSYENDGVPFPPFYDVNDLCAYSCSNAEPVGIGSQVLEPGLPEESCNRGLLQRPHVSLNESPSRTFENSFRVTDFFSKDNGGRQNVKLGDANSSHKRKNVDVVCGESSPIISTTTFNDGITARIVASEDRSLVSGVGNEVGSKRNTRRKITHANQATTSTPNLYLEENSFALCDPWPSIEISFLDVPSNPSVHSRLTGRNVTPNRQHLAHAIPGSTLDLCPPFHVLGSSISEVGSSSQSPMPCIDEATEELNFVSGSSTTTHRFFTSHNRMGPVQDQSNRSLARSSTILSGNAVPTSQVGTNLAFHQLTGENCTAHLHHRRALNQEAVIEPFNFDLHHDHPSKLAENVHREFGPVSRVYPHSFTRTLNMLPSQNGGVSGVPLSASSHATARREGRSRILEGPQVFESAVHWVRHSHDRYRDMRMDIDDMSYEELLALGERIGNVNCGLSEEKILSGLRQRKYISSSLEPSEDAEQCSICREEYVEGQELSRLDCDHDFHTVCIKKWLGIKNLCPICKATGIQGA